MTPKQRTALITIAATILLGVAATQWPALAPVFQQAAEDVPDLIDEAEAPEVLEVIDEEGNVVEEIELAPDPGVDHTETEALPEAVEEAADGE